MENRIKMNYSKNENNSTNNNFNCIKEKNRFLYLQNSLLYSYGNGKNELEFTIYAYLFV